MSDETKCECQHCGGHIAFTPAQAGQSAICPHCGKETVLNYPNETSPKFFVWQNEQQEGPYSQEAIQTMISTGQINGETLVCPEDGAFDWTPAKELFLQDATPENLVSLYATNDRLQVGDESLVEIRLSPSQFFRYRRAKADEKALLNIRLTSGEELQIKAVKLYDQRTLAVVNSKKVEALKKQHGVSTGLGAIGSVEWVLASSLVMDAVEGVLSVGAEAQGTKMLSDAIQTELDLRNQGAFIPVNTIKHIEHPLPGIWLVLGEGKILEQGKDTTFPAAFIHNGDEFVTVQTADDAVRSIRWTAVESYAYQRTKGELGTLNPPPIPPA